jgi:maltooligosyltrehalose trehalohydrolase
MREVAFEEQCLLIYRPPTVHPCGQPETNSNQLKAATTALIGSDMSGLEWQLPFGATLVGGGQVRFRIWAPGQKALFLAVENRAPLAMTARADGWFEVEADCGVGAHYRYVLDDGTAVPDPASRAQSRDVHGPSIVVDPRAYTWRETEWRGRPWEETVFYEVHAGLFGGFEGVARELPRLAQLGVTAIELMPIAEFPGARNWGYDGALLFAPESSYGTPEQLKRLVDAAHARGLMIFLDVVYNHFGPDGNYLASYAPMMFREDVTTPWGPAIDFRHEPVRRFFVENALYWLIEYRFDGLRFDAVHAIAEPDWLDEMAAEIRARIRDRHIHLVLENDDNAARHLARDFDAQWNDDGHHVMHVLLTDEHQGYYQDYRDHPAAQLARCLKEGFVFQGEASPHRGGKPRGTPSAHLPPTAFVLFLQNHDQIGNRAFGERLTSMSNQAALEAAIALQLLCPQIPLIFMGEETASETPFFFFTDHNEELAQAVREGRRKEFASFPQFSDPDLLQRLPEPNARDTFDRSKPLGNSGCSESRTALYRRLLKLRRDHIVPRLAGTHALDAQAIGFAAVSARWRMGDGSILLLACNLGAHATAIDPILGDCLFTTSAAAREFARDGTLAPHATLALIVPP